MTKITIGERTIIKNTKGELIDILPFIPETEKREYVQNQISNLKEPVDGDELDRRIYGIKRYYLNITIPNANRNSNMFKIFRFIKDIAGHGRAVTEANDFNNMLSEPLEEREMKMITRG